MADRTVEIRYATTGVARASAGVRAISRAHASAAKEITAAQSRVASASRAVASVAAVAGKIILFGVGAALAVGAKAAIDFESSMAGVFKTLGDSASASEIVALGEALRAMSLDIPVNVNELAFIAELGGQLGVGIEDMEHFTKTIAALATTTNLSSADAAKGLARFSNILQLPISDVDDLGNIIVALGNNFATTESEILNFGLRLAPIGQTVGATADEILGIAAAFSSLGVPAERGGTAVQRTFIEIEKAVDSGGRELEKFADIAGVTAGEFANLSAVGRFEAFINGLGEIGEAGESVFQALDRVNISQQRSIQVLLAAAGAGDLFSDALHQSNDALEDGDALWEEAARRWGTTASQMQLLVNTFNDFRIEIGQGVIPMLNSVIGFFRDLITAMKDSIGMLKILGTVLVGLVVVKGLLLMGKAVTSTVLAFQQFQEALRVLRVSKGLTAFKAIGATTALLGGMQIALMAVVVALGAYFAWQAKSAKKTRELNEAAKNLNDELDRGVPAVEAWSSWLQEKFADNDQSLNFLSGLGISLREVGAALTDTDSSSLDSIREKMIRLSEAREKMKLEEGGMFSETNAAEEARARGRGIEFIMDLERQRVKAFAEGERRNREELQSTAFLREGIGRKYLQQEERRSGRFGAVAAVQDPLDAFLGSSDENFDAYVDYKNNVDAAMDDMLANMREHYDNVRSEILDSIVVWDEYAGAAEIKVDEVLATLAAQAIDVAEWNSTLATLIAMGVSGNIVDAFNQFDLSTKAGITALLKDAPAEFVKFVEGYESEFARIDAAAIVNANLTSPVQQEMRNLVAVMTEEALALSDSGAVGFEAFKASALEKLAELGPDGRAAFIEAIDNNIASGAYERLFGVGRDVMFGLRDGMLEYRSVLDLAVQGISGGLISKFEGAFELGSPSRRFMRMGRQLGQGLNIGMAQSMSPDLSSIDRFIGSFRQVAMAQSTMPQAMSDVTNNQSTTVNINGSRHGDLRSDITAGLIAGGITRQVETLVK